MNKKATRPLRVAVVGAGPAGLYTVDHLTYTLGADVAVHVYERLPVPFGLLRYGVAPDHPTIKSAAATFQEILGRPGVDLMCNVEVGRDVSVSELREWYDAVVYATGADTDRRLAIPGEALPGSTSATEFVKWYNGHPEGRLHDLGSVRSVAVIGAGNVALDVARILTKPAATFAETDMPVDVLERLSDSVVSDVHIIARRGAEHTRFTTKELRELGELSGVEVMVDEGDLPDGDPTAFAPAVRRNLGLFRAWAGRGGADAPRRIHFHFGRTPLAVLGDTQVRALRFDSVGGVGELDCDLVIRAIGYRPRPLPGVPVHPEFGTIVHREHRVQRDGARSEGEYAVGWAKRGPSGVLGTNRGDAVDTVEALLADMGELPLAPAEFTPSEVLRGRGVRILDVESWGRIQLAEQAAGAARGRLRAKLTDWHDLVESGAAGNGTDAATGFAASTARCSKPVRQTGPLLT